MSSQGAPSHTVIPHNPITASSRPPRIERFHFSDDARLSIAGRLLIRRAVSDVLGVPYAEIDLRRTKEKKPVARPGLEAQVRLG